MSMSYPVLRLIVRSKTQLYAWHLIKKLRRIMEPINALFKQAAVEPLSTAAIAVATLILKKAFEKTGE